MERSIKTALLRNWLKRAESISKKDIHHKKQKEDGTEGQGNKESEIVDLTEEDEVEGPCLQKKGGGRSSGYSKGPSG